MSYTVKAILRLADNGKQSLQPMGISISYITIYDIPSTCLVILPILKSQYWLIPIFHFTMNEIYKWQWVIPEKIHTPPKEEISAFQRGRAENFVSDNSKCIRPFEGGRD